MVNHPSATDVFHSWVQIIKTSNINRRVTLSPSLSHSKSGKQESIQKIQRGDQKGDEVVGTSSPFTKLNKIVIANLKKKILHVFHADFFFKKKKIAEISQSQAARQCCKTSPVDWTYRYLITFQKRFFSRSLVNHRDRDR